MDQRPDSPLLNHCELMKPPLLFSQRAWLLVTACACGFLIWTNVARIRHLDFIAKATDTPASFDAGSLTGYTGGVREFVGAGRATDSYQWVAQTQQILARGDWWVRHIDYDNVPSGRDVVSPSPYRWWLGALASTHHALSGVPPGVAVERVAMFSDSLLHLLLLVGTAAFVARRFGTLAAALLVLGIAAMFPFAASFVAGQAEDVGLRLTAALWSVLPLLVVGGKPASEKSVRRYFFAAGIAGGVGLWLGVGTELPIIAGVALGGLLAAWLSRHPGSVELLPWRWWALGGAVACLAAYLVDIIPSQHKALRLDVIHPLHGLAWLGLGELLARGVVWLQTGKQRLTRREKAVTSLAFVAVAMPVVLAFQARRELFIPDPSSARLTALFDSAIAPNLPTLMVHYGFSAMVMATLLPLILVIPALWLVARGPNPRTRNAVAIALGPVAVAIVLATFQLRWWALLDAVLLTLLVAGTTSAIQSKQHRFCRWLWVGGIALSAALGAVLLIPRGATASVSEAEVEGLIERDLAHWLAQRAGGDRPAILASPNLSASLAFKGGLRALGSPYSENSTGLNLSFRIASATSQDEALALVQRHQITHVVLASWDPTLEQVAELSGDKEQKSLVALLHQWRPPRWLKPIPYRMPQIPGFEGQSVVVFEVVELQDNSVALSHLAEYFVETDQPELAASAGAALKRLFPDDLGATIARVQTAAAMGDQRAANDAFKVLEHQLAGEGVQSLPWDRRVSLAVVLAEARRYDQARAQLEQCLAEMDEPRLRSLTTVSVYHFEQLIKEFGLPMPDSRLRELSRSLLPPEMRKTL
jgi:hypothetical protein